MHFISFVLIYSLWLLRLRQRANVFFREGHPRRYTVTLMAAWFHWRQKRLTLLKQETKQNIKPGREGGFSVINFEARASHYQPYGGKDGMLSSLWTHSSGVEGRSGRWGEGVGGSGACALRLRAAVHQILVQPSMGPLQLAVTWYKIHHAGEQAPHWDIQNKENANLSWWSRFVLDVPVDSLLSSMADFVPCDR